MIRPRHLACILWIIALAAAATACGDGGDSASPTATAQSSPSPATPTALPFVTPDAAAAEPATVVDLATDSAQLRVLGVDDGDLRTAGASVAGGDFNDDGVDDLLLGVPHGDGPDNSREDAGEAYVFYGPRALEGEIDLDSEDADLTILGALPGDNLGNAVIAGDLNGDGIDDIVVGAPGSNGLQNVRTDVGEAYVIFGSSSLAGTVDLAEVEQDFTFRAAEGFAQVGSSFAVGDINDDGIEDLIAGGPFGGRVEGTSPGTRRTTEGEAYVVFGKPDLSGENDLARGEVDVRLKGARELDSFGHAVASGDVNGDGVDDIVVAARRADGPDDSRADAGEVYVFFGSSGLSGKLDSVEADVMIYGREENDSFGSVLATGDLSGDGLADMVISAPLADGPGNARSVGGEAYVIFGSASLGGVVDLADQSPDALVYARDEVDLMPSALALADLDGDGRDDVAMGAPTGDGPDNSRPDGGEAYVLYGDDLAGERDLRVDVDGSLFVYGTAAGEELGWGALWLDLDDSGEKELLLLATGPVDAPGWPGTLYFVEVQGR